jgi:hypothetical protein
VVNYLDNFNPTISRVKILWQITAENCYGILSLTLKADFFGQCYKTIYYCGNLLPFYGNYQGNVAL